ncbi:MAG TPA: phosphatase PAP2 family protein [Acidimicrobiia bacterium]|jgi:undecaprenyl-diphosphatase|nr:phosphatase PAP2 family protein [Acidimicrobiia bacterium]
MSVILAVVLCGLAAALVAGAVAWVLPNFDPAAPHASRKTIAEETRAHPRAAARLRSRLDPASLTGLALTVALAVLIAGTVAIGALLIMVQHNAGLARWDLSAARWGEHHATTSSTQFMRNVSLFGGTPMMIGVALVAGIWQYVRTRTTAVFGFLTVVVVGQVLLTNLTKLLVGRARPDLRQLTGFSGSSFPSGHAATAAATFAAVALLVGRGHSRHTKALLAAGAAFIAVAVATSRVLLGVHWLTDVIAGLAMGWAWFAISSIAFGGRVLRFGQPAEVAQQTSRSDSGRGARLPSSVS